MPTFREVRFVSYEAVQYGVSAEQEGEALSEDFLDMALSHIRKLIHGEIDPFGLQIWREYAGIPLMLVSLGDELRIYAVEDTSERGVASLKISCMFAGARSRGYRGLDGTWDGSDESLWHDVVERRCGLWFGN